MCSVRCVRMIEIPFSSSNFYHFLKFHKIWGNSKFTKILNLSAKSHCVGGKSVRVWHLELKHKGRGMFIEEIIIDGFKSYATRTVVSGFDPNFNAITGLNGSGKSNILDSICFVLGISNLSQVCDIVFLSIYQHMFHHICTIPVTTRL